MGTHSPDPRRQNSDEIKSWLVLLDPLPGRTFRQYFRRYVLEGPWRLHTILGYQLRCQVKPIRLQPSFRDVFGGTCAETNLSIDISTLLGLEKCDIRAGHYYPLNLMSALDCTFQEPNSPLYRWLNEFVGLNIVGSWGQGRSAMYDRINILDSGVEGIRLDKIRHNGESKLPGLDIIAEGRFEESCFGV